MQRQENLVERGNGVGRIHDPKGTDGLSLSGRLAAHLLAVLICLGAIFCAIDCRAAEEPTQREYELKAAVLYHIIEYVEWPKEALAGQPALQLGLVGDIPFAA